MLYPKKKKKEERERSHKSLLPINQFFCHNSDHIIGRSTIVIERSFHGNQYRLDSIEVELKSQGHHKISPKKRHLKNMEIADALTHLSKFQFLAGTFIMHIDNFLFCVYIIFSPRLCLGSIPRQLDLHYVLCHLGYYNTQKKSLFMINSSEKELQ